jgi:hypothetical protein
MSLAILDVSIPSTAFVGFCVRMTLLGFVVTGTVIGYSWVCDACESRFDGQLGRRLRGIKSKCSDAENVGATACQQPTKPRIIGHTRTPHDTRPLFSCDPYVLTLRGSVLPNTASKTNSPRTWHGQ